MVYLMVRLQKPEYQMISFDFEIKLENQRFKTRGTSSCHERKWFVLKLYFLIIYKMTHWHGILFSHRDVLTSCSNVNRTFWTHLRVSESIVKISHIPARASHNPNGSPPRGYAELVVKISVLIKKFKLTQIFQHQATRSEIWCLRTPRRHTSSEHRFCRALQKGLCFPALRCTYDQQNQWKIEEISIITRNEDGCYSKVCSLGPPRLNVLCSWCNPY